MVAQPQSRKTFIDKLIFYIKKFSLDGIDIDWEFPGRLGVSCNIFDDANDAKNFFVLLSEIRSAFDVEFPIGAPMTDVSELANYVDFISIMDYDINGAWSETTGPNSPFDFTPAKGAQFSYKQSIDAWLDAKFPANKLVTGFPFYGRSVTATVDMTQDPTNLLKYQQVIELYRLILAFGDIVIYDLRTC